MIFVKWVNKYGNFGSNWVLEQARKTENQENFKVLIRKNTIALKNLEIVQEEIKSSLPNSPKFKFTKLLGDKIQEVINEDKKVSTQKVLNKAIFTGFFDIPRKSENKGKVGWDMLGKNPLNPS